jgi:ribosome maturation factor RimP
MTKVVVLCLILCVSVMPVFPASAVFERTDNEMRGQSPKELQRQAEFRKKINLMGPGAEIRIALRGSSAPVRYEGVVDEITAESFKLKMKDRTLSIQYGQIETLNLKKQYYRPFGEPDPAQVRQIVAGLGVGQKVRVMLVSNERFSGTIRSFEKEDFVISSRSQSVKFNEVKEIEKKHFPTAAKVVIASVAVLGVIVAVGAATWKGPLGGVKF